MVKNWLIFIILLSTTKYIISSDRQFVPQQKTIVELAESLAKKLKALKEQDGERIDCSVNEKKRREVLQESKGEVMHMRREISNLDEDMKLISEKLAAIKDNFTADFSLFNAQKARLEELKQEKTICLQTLESTILEIEKKLQEVPVISDEQVKEIRGLWDQFLYILLEQNNFEITKDVNPLSLLLEVYSPEQKKWWRLNVHPDKFRDKDNVSSITDLFKVFGEWDGTSELQAFIKKQKLTRGTIKFIEFVETLKKSDSWPNDISQKELNEAKKLWIGALFYSNDIAKHYEMMDEDSKKKINDLLNQNIWNSRNNKTLMANLLSFIKSSQEQTQFMKLEVLQNTFHSYLRQLKMCDGAGQDIQNNQYATLKKLWVSIISFDKNNKSLRDMDTEFQTNIQHLSYHWGKNREKMKDIFGVISSEDDTAKLVLSYQPREEFILHLQKLRDLDDQGKDILDSDILQLRTAWDLLKQNNDTFFQDMDEEFRITTKIYSLPHKWKVNKNRAELTSFFQEALGKKQVRLATTIPFIERKKDKEDPFFDFEMPFILRPIHATIQKMEEWRCLFKSWITQYPKLRPLIDPNYSIADVTLAPMPLNRRIKSALRNLQISSMPAVALNEIKELSCQVMLLKKLYNYNWLDRILYPFHRDDLQSLESDLSALYDKDLLKAIHPDTLTAKGGHSQQDIAKAAEIANIIEDLKTNLLTRPAKPFEIVLGQAIIGEALPQRAIMGIAERVEGVAFNLIGKMAPNAVRSQYEKDVFSSLDHKIENQRQHNALNKQGLKQRKDILRIEIEKFRIKAGVRFQAPAI